MSELPEPKALFADSGSAMPEMKSAFGEPAVTEEAQYDGPPVEQTALAELDDLLARFRAQQDQPDVLLGDVTDSKHWVAVAFQTRAMKDEFLYRAGLEDAGNKYLDGHAVARMLGIDLESPMPPRPDTGLA